MKNTNFTKEELMLIKNCLIKTMYTETGELKGDKETQERTLNTLKKLDLEIKK